MRIASLGMYDLPALQDSNDALWSGLAGWLRNKGLDDVPDRLDRDRPLAQIWDDPDLLLAQTCGLPLVTTWSGRLRYVATPCYAAPGCDGPLYRSLLVVARDSEVQGVADLRGTTAAINERSSNSGYNLLRQAIAPVSHDRPFFAATVLTGSHVASMQAVADGTATVAAIDVVTYEHVRRHLPDLAARVRGIGWTPVSPVLPFVTAITASDQTTDLLRQALAWATQSDELRQACEALLLQSTAKISFSDYTAIAGEHGTDGEDIGIVANN